MATSQQKQRNKKVQPTGNLADGKPLSLGLSKSSSSSSTKKKNKPPPFPWRLYQMLQDVEDSDHKDIVSWVDSGNAFRVHNIDMFRKEIMPVYFKQERTFEAFQGRLSVHRFVRGKTGKYAYSHPQFTRGYPSYKTIERTKRTKSLSKEASSVSGSRYYYSRDNFLPFPWKLYEMLENVAIRGQDDIVSWVENGKALKVHDVDRFLKEIMPIYFTSSIGAFRRQVLAFRFTRFKQAGSPKETFFHPLFARGCPSYKLITRQKEQEESASVESKHVSESSSEHFPFACMLNRMLDDVETFGQTDIVSWVGSSGKAFQVHKADRFVAEIMPKYFNYEGKFERFHEQLCRSGFSRRASTNQEGAYAHPHFTRGCYVAVKRRTQNVWSPLRQETAGVSAARGSKIRSSRQPVKRGGHEKTQPVSRAAMFTPHAAACTSQREDSKAPHHAAVTPEPPTNVIRHRLLLSAKEPSIRKAKVKKPPKRKVRGDDLYLAWKLHQMLEDVEESGQNYIVSWVDNGKAFKIHDAFLFLREIMPIYFKNQSSIRALQSNLVLKGFIHVQTGKHKGAYSKQSFYRGCPCVTMQRTKRRTSLCSAERASGVPTAPDASSNVSMSGCARGECLPFPSRLYQMLQDAEDAGQTDVVSWVDNGRAFQVHNMPRFVVEIMPKYFRDQRMLGSFQQHVSMFGFFFVFESFQQQLWRHGFFYTTPGSNQGAFWHPLFIRACSSYKAILHPQRKLSLPSPRQDTAGVPAESSKVPESSCHRDLPFVCMLYQMLQDVEESGQSYIVSWVADGKAFQVHSVDRFIAEILPRYFKNLGVFESFRQQLILHRFSRIKAGNHEGAYSHPHFSRGCPSYKTIVIKQSTENVSSATRQEPSRASATRESYVSGSESLSCIRHTPEGGRSVKPLAVSSATDLHPIASTHPHQIEEKAAPNHYMPASGEVQQQQQQQQRDMQESAVLVEKQPLPWLQTITRPFFNKMKQISMGTIHAFSGRMGTTDHNSGDDEF